MFKAMGFLLALTIVLGIALILTSRCMCFELFHSQKKSIFNILFVQVLHAEMIQFSQVLASELKI